MILSLMALMINKQCAYFNADLRMHFASQKMLQINHNQDMDSVSYSPTDVIKSCLGVSPVAAHMGNQLARKESLETKSLDPSQ